jgi:diacylglycerol kinase family enzyme
MEVRCNGNVISDTFIYGMITNSVSVGGFKGITGSNVRLDDGVFEVTLIKTPRNPIELNEIIACLTNLIDDSELIYTFKTSEIRFSSEEKVTWTLDGEYGGEHDELVIRNLKQRISIFVDSEAAKDAIN